MCEKFGYLRQNRKIIDDCCFEGNVLISMVFKLLLELKTKVCAVENVSGSPKFFGHDYIIFVLAYNYFGSIERQD